MAGFVSENLFSQYKYFLQNFTDQQNLEIMLLALLTVFKKPFNYAYQECIQIYLFNVLT